jgi:hypothetical protein
MTTTMRHAGKRPLIVWDAILTSILLGLLGVLTFGVSVFGAFLAMASDPCGATLSWSGLSSPRSSSS